MFPVWALDESLYFDRRHVPLFTYPGTSLCRLRAALLTARPRQASSRLRPPIPCSQTGPTSPSNPPRCVVFRAARCHVHRLNEPSPRLCARLVTVWKRGLVPLSTASSPLDQRGLGRGLGGGTGREGESMFRMLQPARRQLRRVVNPLCCTLMAAVRRGLPSNVQPNCPGLHGPVHTGTAVAG